MQEMSRRLLAEQNAEYEASLAADQEREARRQEEARKAQEAAQQQAAEEARQRCAATAAGLLGSAAAHAWVQFATWLLGRLSDVAGCCCACWCRSAAAKSMGCVRNKTHWLQASKEIWTQQPAVVFCREGICLCWYMMRSCLSNVNALLCMKFT